MAGLRIAVAIGCVTRGAVAQAAAPAVVTAPAAPSAETHGKVRLQNVAPPPEASAFIEMRSKDTDVLFASAINGDHESVGVSLKQGSALVGIRGWNAVYRSTDFSLPLPAGATAGKKEFLYAPTSRPPNGSCLEVGTAYQTDFQSPTAVFLYVFDFCGITRRFLRWIKIEDLEKASYLKQGPNSSYMYYFSISPDMVPVSGTTKWTAELFNFAHRSLDRLAQSQGVSSDGRGWSIFETYYEQGQCPRSLPRIYSEGIEVMDEISNKWTPSNPSEGLDYKIYDSASPAAYCFHNDASGLASYKFALETNQRGWAVVSTGH